ncbi:hypothetical protein L204_106034 [Cryptococcus depauperatus]
MESLESSIATLVDERTCLLPKDQTKASYVSTVVIDSPLLATIEDVGDQVETDDDCRQSTDMQTLANILCDLIGTGILASPIAIAYSGWVFGPLILIGISCLTLWTLKIFIRIIEKNPALRDFTEVLVYALGPGANRYIDPLFSFDCFIWNVTLLVLFSDSLAIVLPVLTSDQWKLVAVLWVVPSNFIPLRYLSWNSWFGVVCSCALASFLVAAGILTPSSPGSLLHPAATDLWPTYGWVNFGLSIGLLMSGFGGHFLIPSLLREMKNPHRADRICEIGYAITVVLFSVVGFCGYLMFGRGVSDEISRDMGLLSTLPSLMSKAPVWLVALVAITKLPLSFRPMAVVMYTKLGLHPRVYVPDRKSSICASDYAETVHTNGDSVILIKRVKRERIRCIYRWLVTTVSVMLFVVFAVALPSFECLVGIMGGCISMITCVILPIAGSGRLWGWPWWRKLLFAISLAICLVGTVCSVISGYQG